MTPVLLFAIIICAACAIGALCVIAAVFERGR